MLVQWEFAQDSVLKSVFAKRTFKSRRVESSTHVDQWI